MKSTAQSIDKRSALNPAADITPHAIQATDGVTVKETPMNLLERVQAVGDEMKSLASEALASGDAEVFAALADVGFDVTLVDPYDAQHNVSDVLEAWLCAPMWDRLEEWNANAEPIWHDVAFRVFYETRTDLRVARQILDWGSRDLVDGLYDHFTENDFCRAEYEEAGAIGLFNAKLKLLEGGGGEEDHDPDESDEETTGGQTAERDRA
jgi:hypothetical protein